MPAYVSVWCFESDSVGRRNSRFRNALLTRVTHLRYDSLVAVVRVFGGSHESPFLVQSKLRSRRKPAPALIACRRDSDCFGLPPGTFSFDCFCLSRPTFFSIDYCVEQWVNTSTLHTGDAFLPAAKNHVAGDYVWSALRIAVCWQFLIGMVVDRLRIGATPRTGKGMCYPLLKMKSSSPTMRCKKIA